MAQSQRPTLADVARRAGTSTAVVSYVVNDGPRRVSPATRARVERAIAELGYRRDPLAGALSAGRSDLVGLLVPDTSNGFFGELSHHIEHEGRQRGLLTMLGNTGYDAQVAADYMRSFADLRPRAVFVTNVSGATPPGDIPIVYVHAAPAEPSRPSVIFDDFNGAVLAVSHLVGHGHREIACLTGDDPMVAGPATRREAGWRRVIRELGRSVEDTVHRSAYSRVEAERVAGELLARPDRPTAVFAATDEQALGVLRAAYELSLRVPEDVALASVDGIREAVAGSRRITTIDVPVPQLAREAFDLIDEREPRQVVLAGTLRIGETCGCTP